METLNPSTVTCGAILVAGGSGRRMGGALPKQFRLVDGLPVLGHTINAFAAALPGSPLVVVLPEAQLPFWNNFCARFPIAKHRTAAGGAERFHSVQAGLKALLETGLDPAFVAVHDGVRPLVSTELILRTLACAELHGAAIPAVPLTDSCRRIGGSGSVAVDRTPLRRVQTPQIFGTDLLRRAYAQPYEPRFTDDASLVEALGHPVTLCEGDPNNLKITTPDDLLLAEALLMLRRRPADEQASTEASDNL